MVMRTLFTLFVAIVAFAAGVWYTGGFESMSQTPEISNNATSTPTPTPTPVTTTPSAPKATYQNADTTRIQVTTPVPGAMVPGTFTVTGKAVGGWYFEASFPYEVQNANGVKIAEGPVQAQGEWMTPEFVPFTFQIKLPASYKGKATLILHNDNPSGLPENAASVSIPITIQ